MGENTRLPGAGTRHDQERALGLQDRLALLRVEGVEEGVVRPDRVRH
jgi:hypothetical protein